MKTATQAGWHMTLSGGECFISMYRDSGEMLEVGKVLDYDGSNQLSWFTPDGVGAGDLPGSVLALIGLWFGMEMVS